MEYSFLSEKLFFIFLSEALKSKKKSKRDISQPSTDDYS